MREGKHDFLKQSIYTITTTLQTNRYKEKNTLKRCQ